MRHGNTRIGRGGNGAADARHFFKGHASCHQFFGFFAAASKDVRVAALETGHNLAFLGLAHKQGVDLVLRQGMVARHLAHIDFFRVGAGVPEQAVVGQGVVHHHIGGGQGITPLEGQQARISGTGSDEKYLHYTPPLARSSSVRAPKAVGPTGESGVALAAQSTPAMSRWAQRTPS